MQVMTLLQKINIAFVYIAEAAYRIFSPHDDVYPATGVQPYSGMPYNRKMHRWNE